jgi:hypothetical protein
VGCTWKRCCGEGLFNNSLADLLGALVEVTMPDTNGIGSESTNEPKEAENNRCNASKE